ncbi:MAG: hypothetical protein DMD63_05750 [Gemmatimonadetes bacterium]|nr:MAG: hypothetical protein DMD63_05750 [Gemmatimonadota bacterium]
MTTRQFAVAARADVKWILNSAALLGRRLRYTDTDARWWGLLRLLTANLALPLEAAADAVTRSLAARKDGGRVTARADASESASLVIDLLRYDSIFLANLSRALVLETPRRRGRSSHVRGGEAAIEAARGYGVDIGLIQAALKRTPAARLDMLEANAGFISAMGKKRT